MLVLMTLFDPPVEQLQRLPKRILPFMQICEKYARTVQLSLQGERGESQGDANSAKFSETIGRHCKQAFARLLRSMGSWTVNSFFSWE